MHTVISQSASTFDVVFEIHDIIAPIITSKIEMQSRRNCNYHSYYNNTSKYHDHSNRWHCSVMIAIAR